MTASAFYILAALILIGPHTSKPFAKAGAVLMLLASLAAFTIEVAR